ncbi:GAP family protein [Streptomyces albogriseolus]
MLATPRARTNGPALLLGWSLGLALVGTIVLLVSGGVGPSDQGQPADWVSALDLTLGVLLLWVAVKEWRGRPRAGPAVAVAEGVWTVDAVTPGEARGLGAAGGGVWWGGGWGGGGGGWGGGAPPPATARRCRCRSG